MLVITVYESNLGERSTLIAPMFYFNCAVVAQDKCMERRKQLENHCYDTATSKKIPLVFEVSNSDYNRGKVKLIDF